MGLKRRKAPELAPRTLETLWWGDEAVDREASDLDGWCRTADGSLLITKPGEKASKIVYRALTEREESALPISLEGDPRGITARCYEAARYGLVKISGESLLRRRNEHGLLGLSDATMDDVSEFRAELPLSRAFESWSDALGLENVKREEQAVVMETSLLVWLGIHVIAATFRARGVGA